MTWGKVKSCCSIKVENLRLALGEDEVRRIWKDYFEDLYNIDIQVQVAVHMCFLHVVWRSNYFGGEPLGRIEAEVRVGKLKSGKASGKDEVTGEVVKGSGLDLEAVQYCF